GLGGCANMTTTEQRTPRGAAIGALGGAGVAAVAEHSVAAGAALGAGVGGGGGDLYSLRRNEHQANYHQTKKHHHLSRATKRPKPEAPAPTSDEKLAAN